jgi:uncharacterized protein
MPYKNALIIFIKNPALGKVKTRLAKTVGDEKALEIYLELSRITRENASILRGSNEVETYVFYSDFIDKNDDWSNDIFEKRVQSGEDLGDRMSNAFHEILQQHQHVCIIGSDCPTLSVDILNQSFKMLQNHNFVVGPSTDGGYYLLGISSEQYEFLFKNMEWSTENVLSETLNRIEENDKTIALLPPLTDVDEEKDWVNYISSEQN